MEVSLARESLNRFVVIDESARSNVEMQAQQKHRTTLAAGCCWGRSGSTSAALRMAELCTAASACATASRRGTGIPLPRPSIPLVSSRPRFFDAFFSGETSPPTALHAFSKKFCMLPRLLPTGTPTGPSFALCALCTPSAANSRLKSAAGGHSPRTGRTRALAARRLPREPLFRSHSRSFQDGGADAVCARVPPVQPEGWGEFLFSLFPSSSSPMHARARNAFRRVIRATVHCTRGRACSCYVLGRRMPVQCGSSRGGDCQIRGHCHPRAAVDIERNAFRCPFARPLTDACGPAQTSNGTISKVSCMKKDIHPKFYPEAKARSALKASEDVSPLTCVLTAQTPAPEAPMRAFLCLSTSTACSDLSTGLSGAGVLQRGGGSRHWGLQAGVHCRCVGGEPPVLPGGLLS